MLSATISTSRKVAVLLAGGSVYATAAFMTFQYLEMNKTDEVIQTKDNHISHVSCPHRTDRFQTIASYYDRRIGWDEFFMGISLLRRSLLYFHATGTVLEVGAGTARNLPYYPLGKSVRRVVLTDSCDQMLEQAKLKIKKLPEADQKKFAILQSDSHALPSEVIPDQAFDTVVDTFGLCSYNDPVVVLREMARVCKPNGKILLLEHGRSKSFPFVTNHLDRYAEYHAAKWGCVWNRDLDAILEQSGLHVEILRIWHFGTTYYVVCRPQKP